MKVYVLIDHETNCYGVFSSREKASLALLNYFGEWATIQEDQYNGVRIEEHTLDTISAG